MEEVSTIALFQTLYPKLKAKLVEIPGIEEDTVEEGHREKVEAKNPRAEAQMKEIELKWPVINHLLDD